MKYALPVIGIIAILLMALIFQSIRFGNKGSQNPPYSIPYLVRAITPYQNDFFVFVPTQSMNDLTLSFKIGRGTSFEDSIDCRGVVDVEKEKNGNIFHFIGCSRKKDFIYSPHTPIQSSVFFEETMPY